MKTIIVPTDFSATASDAAHYAAGLALHLQATLKLVHVLPMPVVISDIPIPYDNEGISISEAKRSMEELKLQLQQKTNDKIAITTIVSESTFQAQLECMLT